MQFNKFILSNGHFNMVVSHKEWTGSFVEKNLFIVIDRKTINAVIISTYLNLLNKHDL